MGADRGQEGGLRGQEDAWEEQKQEPGEQREQGRVVRQQEKVSIQGEEEDAIKGGEEVKDEEQVVAEEDRQEVPWESAKEDVTEEGVTEKGVSEKGVSEKDVAEEGVAKKAVVKKGGELGADLDDLDDLDVSTRRLSGEVAQLRRQVATEARRTPWLKVAHQRQYEVLQWIRGSLIIDLSKALEATFGSRVDVPADITACITAGEKVIAMRERHLRMADMFSWLAVEKFSSDPLCANESEEKRWRKAKKEAEGELARKKTVGTSWRTRGYGGQGVYGSGGGVFRPGGQG